MENEQQARAEAALEVTEIVMPQARRFRYGDLDFTIRPEPIGFAYSVETGLGQLLGRIVKEHPEIEASDTNAFVTVLLSMGVQATGKVLAPLLGMDEETLRERVPAYVISELLAAWLEVNRIPELLGNLRRAAQTLQARKGLRA